MGFRTHCIAFSRVGSALESIALHTCMGIPPSSDIVTLVLKKFMVGKDFSTDREVLKRLTFPFFLSLFDTASEYGGVLYLFCSAFSLFGPSFYLLDHPF